jgi:hypothetical protein
MESNTNATPNPAPAVEALPNIPKIWPGAFGIYKYSKQAIHYNLGSIVKILILNLVVSNLLVAILKQPGQILGFLVDGLLLGANILILIASVRRRRISAGEAINQAVKFWLRILGLYILVGISVVISLLLLIVPFFFVMPRLVLSFYYLVDKDIGVIEAYKASWINTKGHVGNVWGIIGASIAMALICLTIIGIPISIYFLVMYSASIVVLYEFLNTKSTSKSAADAPSSSLPPIIQ